MRPSETFLVCALFGCIVSCGGYDPDATIGMPNDSFSSANPLDVVSLRASNQDQANTTSDSSGSFTIGDYVETIQPNTPMFATVPKSGSVPSQVLDQGVGLIILAFNGNYIQVQNEKGEIGYVAKLTVAPQGVSQLGDVSDGGAIVLEESEKQEIADILSGELPTASE